MSRTLVIILAIGTFLGSVFTLLVGLFSSILNSTVEYSQMAGNSLIWFVLALLFFVVFLYLIFRLLTGKQ